MSEDPKPEQLKKLSRFDSLSNKDLDKIVKAGSHVNLPKDWALMSQSTPADKAYLIVEGSVSVRRAGKEVAQLGPGDVIGEMAIVDHKLRNASVVSLTPLEVVHFTKEAFLKLADQVPAFADAVRGTAEDRQSKE